MHNATQLGSKFMDLFHGLVAKGMITTHPSDLDDLSP